MQAVVRHLRTRATIETLIIIGRYPTETSGSYFCSIRSSTMELKTMTGFFQRMRDARNRRQTAHELQSLDHSALKDMGIGRSEIFSVVYGSPSDRKRSYSAPRS